MQQKKKKSFIRLTAATYLVETITPMVLFNNVSEYVMSPLVQAAFTMNQMRAFISSLSNVMVEKSPLVNLFSKTKNLLLLQQARAALLVI